VTPSLTGSGEPTAEVPVLNIANVLTVLRIVLVPVFVVVFFVADAQDAWWRVGAFMVFAVAMLTDYVDGYLARRLGLVTDFGKIADPIADKALMAAALICLNITGALPVWITVVILVREFGITFWRMYMLRRGLVVPASKGGKVKTVLQSLAVALYLVPFPSWMDIPTIAVMLAAVAVTVVTGVQYLLDSRQK